MNEWYFYAIHFSSEFLLHWPSWNLAEKLGVEPLVQPFAFKRYMPGEAIHIIFEFLVENGQCLHTEKSYHRMWKINNQDQEDQALNELMLLKSSKERMQVRWRLLTHVKEIQKAEIGPYDRQNIEKNNCLKDNRNRRALSVYSLYIWF